MATGSETFGDHLEIIQDDAAQIRQHDRKLAGLMFFLHNSSASESQWAAAIYSALNDLFEYTDQISVISRASVRLSTGFDLGKVSVTGGVKLNACEFQLEFRKLYREVEVSKRPDLASPAASAPPSGAPSQSHASSSSHDAIPGLSHSGSSVSTPSLRSPPPLMSPLPSALGTSPPVSSRSSARSGIRIPDLAITATVAVDDAQAGGRKRAKTQSVTTTTVACTGEIKSSDTPEMRRLGFAQGLAYLLIANELCGTWLGLVLVRTRFTRLIHLGNHTIAVEAPNLSEPTAIEVADLLNGPDLGQYLVHELYGGIVDDRPVINRAGVDMFYGVFRAALGIVSHISIERPLSCYSVAAHSSIAADIRRRTVKAKTAVGTAQACRAVFVGASPELAQRVERKDATVLDGDQEETRTIAGDQAGTSDQSRPDSCHGEGGTQLSHFVKLEEVGTWARGIILQSADSCAQPRHADADDPEHMLDADDDEFSDDLSDGYSNVFSMSPGDLIALLGRLCKVILISTEEMTALQADMASPSNAPL